MPLRWENCATRLALHCHPGGRTMRRQQENFAIEVGMRFQGGEPGTDVEPTWNRT
ncbi:MAG: hypothetical protein IJ901_03230 [Bacteroidaceae bacterium]|nr:hypothetical protein [Bacteroidaceae bacterium]